MWTKCHILPHFLGSRSDGEKERNVVFLLQYFDAMSASKIVTRKCLSKQTHAATKTSMTVVDFRSSCKVQEFLMFMRCQVQWNPLKSENKAKHVV